MSKEEILHEIENVKTDRTRNSMGCYENWYNEFYSIRETFSKEDLQEMTEKELNDLVKLACRIADGLY